MSNSTPKVAKLISAAVAAIVIASGTVTADAQQRRVNERIRSAFPAMTLAAKEARGQAAVDQLGPQLAGVASWYDLSATELRNRLLSDRRMRVDRGGRLFAVEELEAPLGKEQVDAATAQESIQQGALVSLDRTFFLHSHPGASRTIYLDFNGASITGTAWNSNGNTINAAGFDLDGTPSSFSVAELQRIQYIWQRVAEDYAPFDVNVTTEQPAQDVLTRSGTNDQVFGTTVVITRTEGVYSCNCGGIAYVGVFNYSGGTKPADYYKPAFVFYDKLGGGNEKVVAEAISHEAGHNMGLHHDGTSASSYYTGQGTDPATGWAPIMGVGYYKPLVQFSRGDYGDANNKEDDFVTAQSFGLPLRADDFGNTVSSATPLQASAGATTALIDGVIEAAGDRDVFSIAAGRGGLTATVSPASRSGNADIVLTLMDASGSILATANPLNSLGASVTFSIPAQGTYFLEVRGTGQGDPMLDGYSAYGSVGNFRLAANFAAPVGTSPVAVLSADVTSGVGPLAVTFDAGQSTDDGRVAFWYWDFGDGNVDHSGSLASVTHVYQAPGTFAARLTVVDDSGLSATSTQLITVINPAPTPTVQLINMKLKTGRRGISATAAVTVLNESGRPIRGAKVMASWGGAVSKSLSRKSAASGTASFASPVSSQGGCFTLTVTSITATGQTFSNVNLPSAEICG